MTRKSGKHLDHWTAVSMLLGWHQLCFSMMLKKFIENLDDDGAVYIYYRLDCSLFYLRRLHPHN